VPEKLDNSRNKRQSDSLFRITNQIEVFSGTDSPEKVATGCVLCFDL
jgi:hypothetical protein